MSGESRYDEGIADIKEQIRQIEANQAEDFDGSCTAVIIDLPHAKAILARLSTQSERRDTERLLWVMNEMRESFLHDFVSHVLRRGGAGDISDCRTWIDTKMGADHDGAKP